jgi:hypothetical protein
MSRIPSKEEMDVELQANPYKAIETKCLRTMGTLMAQRDTLHTLATELESKLDRIEKAIRDDGFWDEYSDVYDYAHWPTIQDYLIEILDNQHPESEAE